MLAGAREPGRAANDTARSLHVRPCQRSRLFVEAKQFRALSRRRLLERVNNGQRYLALAEIAPDRLSERNLVADEVENVVGYLKSHPDVVSIIRLRCNHLGLGLSQVTSD